jgi:F-type H+-transporting ATPase subunit b
MLLLVIGSCVAAAATPRMGVEAHAAAVVAAPAQEQGGGPPQPENASEGSRQEAHGEPLWKVLARLLNFAILVGVLLYFLRAPVARYLARRSSEIRGDLVRAAEMREAASAQIASIERRMKALPGDIEALKTRGAQEIAAEEAHIREAAAAERARLLEQSRREIDLQLRAAERELVKRAADLTIGLASDRIKRTITDEDRSRLVDRYLAQMERRT